MTAVGSGRVKLYLVFRGSGEEHREPVALSGVRVWQHQLWNGSRLAAVFRNFHWVMVDGAYKGREYDSFEVEVGV